MERGLTRREMLRAAAITGAGAGLAGLAADPLLSPVLAAGARRGKLKDIEHVIVLIQENRSFDHYFGTFPGARGFGDPAAKAVLAQPGYPAAGFDGKLLPFHLNTGGQPQCFPDITHDWGPQHQSWNGGAMDGFVRAHLAVDGPAAGPATMGYYEQQDIPFYWALAQAYTLCDAYHCSVIGPTYPNRLLSVSATLDPAGQAGGPLLHTLASDYASYVGRFSWTTMFEQLQSRGISWKVYNGSGGGVLDNMLVFFKQFQSNPTLNALGLKPTLPGGLHGRPRRRDAARRSRGCSPGSTRPSTRATPRPRSASIATRQILEAIWSKPKLWAKTAIFITWDENGGFFDHVAPPTPPPGTPGEYVTVNPLPSDASGVAGPIGLGFRVPMIVVSPFSRGGFISSDRFDHTSMLRFLETRFGAEVPNLSAWRRAHTGDLTSAFNFAGAATTRVPRLPAVTLSAADVSDGGCTVSPPAAGDGPGERRAEAGQAQAEAAERAEVSGRAVRRCRAALAAESGALYNRPLVRM